MFRIHRLIIRFFFILILIALSFWSSPAPTAGARSNTLPSEVISIWGGARESIALKADGSVWTWGLNDGGKLGIGTSTNTGGPNNDRHVPTRVHGPDDAGYLSDVIAIMGGEHDNFVLKKDGSVWSWGWNTLGLVGDGTFTDRYFPVPVSGLTHVVALGGRGYHSLAVKEDGSVWAWGWNARGQLGHDTSAVPCPFFNGATTNCSSVPVQVDGISGPTAVTGGGFFSLALMPDETLRAWGANESGQLGDQTTTDRPAPVVVKVLDHVSQVSAGWKHAIALKQDGTVWTWGDNSVGELGNNSILNSSVPIQVPGLDHVISVSAGDRYSAVLKDDGTIWTWGWNGFGQLGDGTFADRHVPGQVTAVSDVVLLAARDYHTIVKKSDGTLWAWGSGENGELGENNIFSRSLPVQVIFSDSLQFFPLIRN